MEPGTVATAMSEYSTTSADGRRWIPWFREMFDAHLNSSMERVVERAVDLASGRADVLSGRYIPLADDLDDLVASASRIREDTMYSLRISRLAASASSPQSLALRALRARGEMASPSVVRIRRRLPIDAHQAFDLWRDGATVAAWFLPPDGAQLIGQPTMEPHASGRFDLRLSFAGARYHVFGTVTDATPGASLALNWSWESDSPILASGNDTSVTMTFAPARDGVDVIVTHEGLPGEVVRDAYIRGWRRCLDGMHRLIASSPSGMPSATSRAHA
jgi:uncharacterized protein YndB with AHSA1/START domain